MKNGRRIGFVACLVIACVLTGCAPTKEDPAMDHTEAKTEVDNLFQTVQSLVGGEWERHDSGAIPCTLPSGEQGTLYKLRRTGPAIPADQQQAVLDQIASEWSDSGFESFTSEWPEVVEGITVTAMRYPESGNGQDGLTFELTSGINGTTLDSRTRCVPGDADEINRQD